MAKASPLVRSTNAGEFSALMEGRTDVERYAASMRKLHNFIAAPQGPALCRSGTAFVTERSKSSEFSALVPFIPRDEQALMLEISSDRIRFINEDGLLLRPEEIAGDTYLTTPGGPLRFEFDATGFTFDITNGRQVFIYGFPNEYGLNGVVASIVAWSKLLGSDTYRITLDVNYPAGKPLVDGNFQFVYEVISNWTLEERQNVSYVQSVDVIYLLTGNRPRKLSRSDTYDWTLTEVKFVDGPFLPVNDTPNYLKPTATGNAIPAMTQNVESFGTASASNNRPEKDGTYDDPVNFLQRQITYHLDESHAWHAFAKDEGKYWAANNPQTGSVIYEPTTGFKCDGYSIAIPFENLDPTYTSKDHAPSTWRFSGRRGGVWYLLDRKDDYVLWDNHRSAFFEIKDGETYNAYRLTIQKCRSNGLIEPRVRALVLRSAESSVFNLSADSRENINGGRGFRPTDVGRLVRIKGTDARWRSCEIQEVNNTTNVQVRLLGDPLPDVDRIREWQLGYWSDTTGWPTVGDFIDDRLYLCSCREYPDMYAGSVVADYENFAASDPDGVVLDDSAVVLRLNSRKQAAINWISADDKAVILGTASEEYVMTAASTSTGMTAKNFRVRRVSGRGSARVLPVRIDKQILYIQKSGRTVREFTYTFESDGYKSPSMSQLSGHMGVSKFAEMDYAAEPHNLVWFRREDGTAACMTYNRDENVIGWHTHEFNGEIVATATMPSPNSEQDTLWIEIARVVNGQTKYYIEYLKPFWSFHNTVEDAWFVDCALSYDGAPLTTLYGLGHLNGLEVYGLADGRPFGPLTVQNGSLTFETEISSAVIGLGFEAEAETSRLENGAADGTALGKVKRINNCTFFMWSSQGGQYGLFNDELNQMEWSDVEYPQTLDELDNFDLYTGKTPNMIPEHHYSERGSIAFRKRKQDTLPFNVVAIAPQLNTQDR